MGVYQRKDSRFWWVWVEGDGRRFSSGVPIGSGAARRDSRLEAEEIYRAAMGDKARQRFQLPQDKPARTFREHATWYAEHVASQQRGRVRARSMIRNMVDTFGDVPLRRLDRHAIEEWKTARARAVKPATVNRELDILKPLLQSAVPKYLDANPAAGVKRFPVRPVPIAILSERAEDALLKVATPEERALVLLGLDALLRLGDARRLAVDQDKRTHLELLDTKVEAYKVPVSARLRQALDALAPQGGYYFARRYRERWRPMAEGTAFTLFASLCNRAKVPRGRKAGGVTFHSLRHTGATRAARAVKLTVVQRLGGWKSLRQLERYDHPDDPEIVRAVEAIGSRQAHAVSTARETVREKRRSRR